MALDDNADDKKPEEEKKKEMAKRLTRTKD